ncbi:MAG TPA: CHAT domain-containing protein [Jatrophihabitantaceae bacterium]
MSEYRPEDLLPLALSRPRDAEHQARRLLTEAPSALERSYAHQALGIVLRDRGEVDAALSELRSALRAAKSAGGEQRIADVLATQGSTQVVAGRSRTGLARLTRALELSRGATRARAQLRRAHILMLLGREREALGDLRAAILTFRSTNDVIWEARSLNNRCDVYLMLGSAGRAERDAVRAEQLFVACGQELEAVHACQNRGDIAYLRGNLPEALRLLALADERYRRLGVRFPEFIFDKCRVLLAAGLPSDALQVATGALDWPNLQPSRRADLLLAAATAALAAGQPEGGEGFARQASRTFQAQQRAWWLVRSRLMRLRCQFAAGQANPSMLKAATEIAQTLRAEHSDDATIAFLLAGEIAVRRDNGSARSLFQAAASRRYRGSALSRSVGWLAHALAYDTDGRDAGRVLAACGRGLDALDEHRMTLGSTELRALATEHARALSDLALRHAVRASDRTLLEWTERTRATTLLAPSVLAPGDTSLVSQLAALRAVASRLDEARAAGLPTTWLERERSRHEAAIRAQQHHRGASAKDSPSRVDVDDLIEAADDAVLVELVDLEEALYAMVVHKDTVERYEIGPLRDAMEMIGYAQFQLRRVGRGGRVDLAEVGMRFERAVLGDVVGQITDAPVVIVPPSRMHASPWGIAPSLLAHPFTVAPSAAMWLRARRIAQPSDQRIVLVAGPGLGTEGAEVHAVAARRPDALLLERDRARTEPVIAAIDGASLAHIAAHGKLRVDNPMFSELRLHDGPLTVYDFERLKRAPYRLVLSACDSGRVAAVGTDELLGLATTLLGMGSAGVVSSITVVNDAATVPVMESIHTSLEAGADLAHAMLASRQHALDRPVELATAASFIGLGT